MLIVPLPFIRQSKLSEESRSRELGSNSQHWRLFLIAIHPSQVLAEQEAQYVFAHPTCSLKAPVPPRKE